MTNTANVALVAEIDTPLGAMTAAATQTHLMLLEFSDRSILTAGLSKLAARLGAACEPGESPVHVALRAQFAEYFAGGRREFDIPLLYPGTEFQERVWNALRQIPVGTTCSYQSIARTIGNVKAVRAVARANGDNRIAIIIPCHRVIGADGSMTGYGGGIWRKERLLELEGGERRLI